MFKKTGQKIWKLVDQHLEYVYDCFCAFEVFMESFLGGTKAAELQDGYNEVDRLEGLADHARRNLINAFVEGSLLPSTRKELLDVTASMDKIANKCQDLCCKLVYENVHIPGAYRANMKKIVEITIEQYQMMRGAIKLLFDDYEQLLRPDSVLKGIKEMESKVDQLEDETTIAIFQDASLELAKKNHIQYFLTHLCDISDKLEDIADQIQIIVVLRKV